MYGVVHAVSDHLQHGCLLGAVVKAGLVKCFAAVAQRFMLMRTCRSWPSLEVKQANIRGVIQRRIRPDVPIEPKLDQVQAEREVAAL